MIFLNSLLPLYEKKKFPEIPRNVAFIVAKLQQKKTLITEKNSKNNIKNVYTSFFMNRKNLFPKRIRKRLVQSSKIVYVRLH